MTAIDRLSGIGSDLDSAWEGVIDNAGNYSGSFSGALEGMAEVSKVSQSTDVLINVAGKVTSMSEKASGKVAG